MSTVVSHEVFNPSTALVDQNLFTGNQANASSEVEFEGAAAWLVGEEGRGMPQILAMGAITWLDCALARVLGGLDGGAGEHAEEAQARRLACDTALVLQAALLRQHSTDAVFAAFCASRLAEASDVYGSLPARLDLGAIVARTQLH